MRFGFWGAEELGLLGSNNYLESLDVDALKDIALYLNFDMVGSPNPGYFTYDGDQSAQPDPRNGGVRGCPRAPRVSSARWWPTSRAPESPRRTSNFDGRSDYDGFTQAGVPAGGLFSGAEEKMSAEQAERWGGEADQPFDPNYHKKTDTLDHIDPNGAGDQRRRRGVRGRALRAGSGRAQRRSGPR